MTTTEPPIKTLNPSILQYLHLFILPALAFLLPAGEEFQKVVQSLFWSLEAFTLAYALLMIQANRYYVTNHRVESKTLNPKTFMTTNTSIPIENITEIYVRQNPLQSLFGIGNLEVDTAGGNQIELVMIGIEKPVEVQNFILGLKGNI